MNTMNLRKRNTVETARATPCAQRLPVYNDPNISSQRILHYKWSVNNDSLSGPYNDPNIFSQIVHLNIHNDFF